MKIVVIGAGASGLIACSKINEDNEVILLERNNNVGKKILLTGNGRCNYWNSDITVDKYNTDNVSLLGSILEYKDTVYNYLQGLGIYPKIKNGYYYPNSNQASSVQNILRKGIEKDNVKIVYNCKVEDIVKENDKFIIKSNLEDIECDKVIVASGSKSCPKTGSEGNLFEILSKYHTLNPILPSLVPLKVNKSNSFLKEWNNLRVDGKVSLYINGRLEKEEIGEIQLTEYGISGIPTFNISSKATTSLYNKDKVEVKLNFLPGIDVLEMLDNRSSKMNSYTIEELLESVLPYQLSFLLLKESNINKEDNWNNIDINKKKDLVNNITNVT